MHHSVFVALENFIVEYAGEAIYLLNGLLLGKSKSARFRAAIAADHRMVWMYIAELTKSTAASSRDTI